MSVVIDVHVSIMFMEMKGKALSYFLSFSVLQSEYFTSWFL